MQDAHVPSPRSVLADTRTSLASLFQPIGAFMVRAPLFPVEVYHQFSAQASEHPSMLLATHPLARLAIGIASPSLLEALERSATGQRDARRRDDKLLRYLIRMSTRPTPYGLFAGVALGRLEETTNLSIANPQACLQARLDMGWLMSCLWKLEALPQVRRHLRWVTNSAVSLRNGRVWLHERAVGEATHETPGISLRATTAVTHALRLAHQPVTYADLVAGVLGALPGATLEQVEGLLNELWQQTVLLSDLRPPLTGEFHPAKYIQQRLAAIPATTLLSEQLATILEEVQAWEAEPGAITVPNYRVLLEQLEQFTAACHAFIGAGTSVMASSSASHALAADGSGGPKPMGETRMPRLLQVDLGLGLAGQTLVSSVGADVARMAEVLLRLTPFPRGPASLTAYRNAFIERYGEDRLLPLVELLDQHVGLGPLELAGRATVQGEEAPANAKRNSTLITLALTAQQKRQLAVELDEDTLKRLETWTPDLATTPTSLDLNVLLAADSAEAVESGRYQLILGPNVGGQAGGRNFGRFASLLGREGIDVLRQIAAHEERQAPGCLIAEVVYLPKQHRLSNLTIRPAIARCELPYGTSPGVTADQAIPLNELVVGVRQGRFYLRWPRRNVDVIPHTGHMLHPHAAPPIVRFLSSISLDGTPLLSNFDWGAAQDFPFLPRVQMGHLVFALAQWRLTADLRERDLPTTSPETFHAALNAWRAWWQVPRYVYLSFADNRLLLDLEQTQQREQLRTELHKLPDNAALILQEVLPTLDHVWVQGPEGHYVTELIFPLLRRGTPQTDGGQATTGEETVLERSNISLAASPMPTAAQRIKTLGSEWLFVKLYVSRDLQEELLAGPLRVFASDMLTAGFAHDWFFLRYSDPDPHLRLRFRGEPQVLMGKLLPALCERCTWLITQGPCLKYCLDTYDREIERYGGLEGMELAESLFGADSRAVVDMLAALAPAGKLALERQVVATLTVDDLLMSLGADTTARMAWARWRVRERHQAGQTYRQHGKQLRLLISDLAQALANVPAGTEVLSILAERRRALAPIAAQLKELRVQRALCQPLTALYASYVHLHCNRLLGLDRSDEEEVIGLLLRTYEGLECAPVASHR